MAGLILARLQGADFCSKGRSAAMAAGFEEPPRCRTNPVECLQWTEGLGDCQGIAWPIKRRAACQLYAYGVGKALEDTVAFKRH